ncbi:MAG: hypothetical protein IPN71_00215 [Fibrobacteres bacterium]|nr:hypothetical protein [Fibrobacterota bacterium]
MEPSDPYTTALAIRQTHLPARRDSAYLVAGDGAVLPDRCVKCNAPGHHRQVYKFTWHKPWLFALAFANPIVYILIAPFLREKLFLELSLCQAHRSKRLRGWIILSLGVVLGPILLILGIREENALVVVGVLVFLVGLVVGLKYSSLIAPDLIQSGAGRFVGCGSEFLETLGNTDSTELRSET